MDCPAIPLLSGPHHFPDAVDLGARVSTDSSGASLLQEEGRHPQSAPARAIRVARRTWWSEPLHPVRLMREPLSPTLRRKDTYADCKVEGSPLNSPPAIGRGRSIVDNDEDVAGECRAFEYRRQVANGGMSGTAAWKSVTGSPSRRPLARNGRPTDEVVCCASPARRAGVVSSEGLPLHSQRAPTSFEGGLRLSQGRLGSGTNRRPAARWGKQGPVRRRRGGRVRQAISL